ncbi:MAG: hypothetical protein HGB08_03535 [Candidatus Moranbacteria bacterium]|nr:hypothetical protein [Candidatus Moranbacteria bacterium]
MNIKHVLEINEEYWPERTHQWLNEAFLSRDGHKPARLVFVEAKSGDAGIWFLEFPPESSAGRKYIPRHFAVDLIHEMGSLGKVSREIVDKAFGWFTSPDDLLSEISVILGFDGTPEHLRLGMEMTYRLGNAKHLLRKRLGELKYQVDVEFSFSDRRVDYESTDIGNDVKAVIWVELDSDWDGKINDLRLIVILPEK